MAFRYGLRKCRRILKQGCEIYKHARKRAKLKPDELRHFEHLLGSLDHAVLNKNKVEANSLAHQLEIFLKENFSKTFFDHSKELVFALVFAIVVAFAIRQVWFELYEVPTGSMRPTVEELDRLIVSKSTFGIHLPFQKKLLFFSPDYIKRTGIVVFTVEGMDVSDADTMYFYLFPGKKRYIKRCMAKPGDTIYFYGGRIYAIDVKGNPINELIDENFLKNIQIERLEHIPYITMSGKTALAQPMAHGMYATAAFFQMNAPVGKLRLSQEGIQGEFYNGQEWVKDQPDAMKRSHHSPKSFSDLWGIGNYAMARLLTKEQVKKFYNQDVDVGELYLELHHTPNFTYPKPELRQGESGNFYPTLTPFTSIIPLQKKHLETLQKSLFTARFYIKQGHSYRYHEETGRPQRPEFDPLFPNVPDGCYEFYYGKGYKVHFGGILTELPSDHPLYNSNSEQIQKLFNLGIAFNLLFQPMAPFQPFVPQRFAYFRNGDLFVMGAPLMKKDDPVIKEFVKKEIEKQDASSSQEPYVAFIDRGPPLNNHGQMDVEFIKAFGLKIPENGLLALGDNYAMSADSRDFGFVPVENLRGTPSFIFWPIGKRFGTLPQPSYPWLTVPNLIVWSLVAIIVVISWILWQRQKRKPLFKKNSP
jgi:signal peptidase I